VKPPTPQVYISAAVLVVMIGLLFDWYLALGVGIGAGVTIWHRWWSSRDREDRP
jgi:hypothetical protein